MADDIIYLLKRNKGPIIKLAKKIFRWFKQQKQQSQQQPPHQQQQQQQQYYGGGYAQPPTQQQHYTQQYPQPPGPPTGNLDQPPPQGEYPAPWLAGPASGLSGVKPNHPNFDDNRVNSANARYRQLRDDARKEGDAMARCFDQSHAAYSKGDGARAKQLSNEGNQHKARMEQLNHEAAQWIFRANNEDSASNEIDLHGLYTREAIACVESSLRQAQAKGIPQLRLIVGKGIHSRDHVAQIKPAIEKLMRDYNLSAHLDSRNAGVLVVDLGGSGGGAPAGGGYRDAGFTRELAKQASGNEEQCAIM